MRLTLSGIWLSSLALTVPLAAQGVLGTWTASGPSGVVTLTLRISGGATISGTLSSKSATFQIQGQMQKDAFMGEATGGGLRSYVEAKAQGTRLVLVMADYGPGGVPNAEGARQLMFSRVADASGPAGRSHPAPGTPAKPAGKNAAAGTPAGGAPGSIGGTPQDQQLAQLLLGSRWCNFTYNQRTGTSHQETVSLSREGILTVSDGTETYSSGYAGTVAGASKGGHRYYWRIQGGLLHLSLDGVKWAPQAGTVQLNSSGQPIIKTDGKEYSRCN